MPNDSNDTKIPKTNEKYSKDIKEKQLKFEIKQLENSINFNIINYSEIIPSKFSSESTFEDLLKKHESLSSFKSINKLYLFFTKLVDKNKFKIDKKNNYYSLIFFYEDKLEDIEIEFNIKVKDLNEEEKNQNFANSINKLSEQFNCLKQEFNIIKLIF